MDTVTFGLLIAITVWTALFLVQRSASRHRKGLRQPPGPYSFPIIGNIFQVGSKPHQSLAKLSKIYGPLMAVKVGCCRLAVVSSPDMAKEMLTKHDLAISGRFTPMASEACEHNKFSFSTIPVNSRWRKLRKICKEQLFAAHRLEASQGLRLDKLQTLYNYVKDCCIAGRAVNIEEASFAVTLNLMSVTLFSLDLGDMGSESIAELKRNVTGVIDTFSPNVADFFPILKGIDPQGLKHRGEIAIGKLMASIGDVIQQRLSTTSSAGDSPKKHDMLEALLDPKNGKDYDLSIDEVQHLLVELLAAGADTLATVVEWAMTELLRHPKQMATLKEELVTVIGKDKQVEESDISKLPYLQAVIKETFRYHPPAPFLLPHQAESDIEVNGFLIPKYTQVLINVWSMGRDPSIWPNPESFQPERFLDSNVDFLGHHFELLPFGSGRRICPGIPLAYRMLHLMLAFFVHNFDWKLEPGVTPETIDVREKNGISIRKMIPLKAIPASYSF